MSLDQKPSLPLAGVDTESEVLDVLVQSQRNKHAELKLMRKLLKNVGRHLVSARAHRADAMTA
jgi:transposase-like protein